MSTGQCFLKKYMRACKPAKGKQLLSKVSIGLVWVRIFTAKSKLVKSHSEIKISETTIGSQERMHCR